MGLKEALGSNIPQIQFVAIADKGSSSAPYTTCASPQTDWISIVNTDATSAANLTGVTISDGDDQNDLDQAFKFAAGSSIE
jgi:hypothetical protein